MKAKTLILLASASIAFGCRSTQTLSTNERDGLLAYVPESEQTEIAETRRESAELREDVAIAERDLVEVRNLRGIAEANCSTAEARLADASSRVRHARNYSNNEEVDTAEQTRQEVGNAMRLEQAKSAYYADLEVLAEKRRELVERRAELADARLELAKAKAVADLDRPLADKVDVAAHRDEVAEAADAVELALIEMQVARHRVELRQQLVERRQQNVPEAMRTQPVEAMDKVFAAEVGDDAPAHDAAADKAEREEMREEKREERKEELEERRDGR